MSLRFYSSHLFRCLCRNELHIWLQLYLHNESRMIASNGKFSSTFSASSSSPNRKMQFPLLFFCRHRFPILVEFIINFSSLCLVTRTWIPYKYTSYLMPHGSCSLFEFIIHSLGKFSVTAISFPYFHMRDDIVPNNMKPKILAHWYLSHWVKI